MKGKMIRQVILYIVITLIVVWAGIPVVKNLNFGLDLKGGFEILYKVTPLEEDGELTQDMLTATYKSISKRVDSLGVSEPEIIIEGENIRVKLAGVKDEEEAKERLSTPAVLSFRDTEDNLLMDASVLKPGGASVSRDENGRYVVALNIADNETFYKVTKQVSESADNFIVTWLDFDEKENSYETDKNTCNALNEGNCISVASVSEGFSGNVILQGNFSKEEVEELTDLINSGSLPTKLTSISSKTVDASFGTDTLYKAGIAAVISISLILLVLTIVYRVSGFLSGLCLIVYTFLVFLIFNLIDGVLTLPGIAAMILGIGMAVDSNVITFERIKDELKKSSSIEKAVELGSKSSLVTILDANITTFIAAIILFIFGESSVKGFATTLIITIIVTMITMVFFNRMITKGLVKTGYFGSHIESFIGLKIKDNKKKNKSKTTDFFTKNAMKFALVSVVIFVIASIFYFTKGVNLGVDFLGGTSINVMSTDNKLNMEDVKGVLKNYEISDINTVSSEEGMVKLNIALDDEQMKDVKSDLKELGYDSDISVISNIVKKELTKNALVSLLYASIAMLIYVAIRFTFNFSVAAVVPLIHDVLMMVAIFVITRMQINFIFIAALLTIIGYSINDTIVLFDRIRENIDKEFKGVIKTKEDVYKVVNLSVKDTLFRTILTTLSTLIPIITLLCFGISSIYEFNIALLVGLIAGVYSSVFIAAIIWALFTIKDLNKPEDKKKVYEDELDEMIIKGINA